MKSRAEVEQELSLAIASDLESAVRQKGEASLLVSGGTTPVGMFQLLSTYEICWSKVTISLVDERFLSPNHKDSNERLVREYLLKNAAKNAQFIPLVVNDQDEEKNLEEVRKLSKKIEKPFTVVVLGMGNDGHTASLFPESLQLEKGMNMQNDENLILTEPGTAPYTRISYTRRALLSTEKLFLHCYGKEKKEILDQIRSKKSERYPISGFINQDKVRIEVFWTN